MSRGKGGKTERNCWEQGVGGAWVRKTDGEGQGEGCGEGLREIWKVIHYPSLNMKPSMIKERSLKKASTKGSIVR